jgi:hypothetical protein
MWRFLEDQSDLGKRILVLGISRFLTWLMKLICGPVVQSTYCVNTLLVGIATNLLMNSGHFQQLSIRCQYLLLNVGCRSAWTLPRSVLEVRGFLNKIAAVLMCISSVSSAIREFNPENHVKTGRKWSRHADCTSCRPRAEYPIVKIPKVFSNGM